MNLADVMADPRFTFVRADIADGARMARVFARHAPSAVVNLAAHTHVDRSIDSPGPFIESNIVGAFTLLECARRHFGQMAPIERAAFRFLQVSTDEVYGTLGRDGLFSEETPYAPNSPYAASKAAADHLVRAYFHTYGLPTLITNCSNNYGPYQFPEKLIPLMILNAREGRPLPVYGDGANVRDWLHVEDHCAALLHVLSKGRPGRTVQHRRRQRAHESGHRRSDLRRAGSAAACRVQPGAEPYRELPSAQDIRRGSPGSRSALCDRRVEDSAGDRLGAAPCLRGRLARDCLLVPGESRLVRGGPAWPIRPGTAWAGSMNGGSGSRPHR